MLTREQNEMVTRTGPGTPLGAVMRRYWIPVALSAELAEPDGPPVRLQVLGERLVAFRDSSGRLGLLDELCAHRCASLFLGRNEEDGLRCVYHGWKYDVTGQCVEQPTEPPESTFRQRIRLTAYPTLEMGDVVWAYLGPRDQQPPPPRFEWTQVSASHRAISRTWQECNWLQALEGGIDSIHASFLHRAVDPTTTRPGTKGRIAQWADLREDVYPTDYGLYYGSTRPVDDGQYVRVYHYVLPFHTFFPHQIAHGGPREIPQSMGHMFVPMDDENCMVYNLYYRFGGDAFTPEERERNEWHRGRGPGEIGADFRKVRNRTNDWGLNRAVQRTETFSGIDGINAQDHAVQESMGPIVDRSREHLGSSDKAVIAARRLLLEAVRQVADGQDPPAMGTSYYQVRAVERILPAAAAWPEALRDAMFPAPVVAS